MISPTSGFTATGVALFHVIFDRTGLMYSARMVVLPDERVSCRRRAGIQRARDGGRMKVLDSVSTVSTPRAAHASWCLSCLCHSNRVPAAIGKFATMTRASTLRRFED